MLKSILVIAMIALGLAACSKRPAIDSAHPPNILLIVLDAARADHFSCYGYQRRTTPELDRVAGEGVRFERAVSTSSWTLPAHASLFTGLLPDEHGAHNQHAWLVDRIPTLAGLLKARGYRTGCFTNNPIIDEYHNLARGFEVLEKVWADSAVISDERPHNSEYTNARVRAFAGERDGRPFFAFINYMDVHQPYAAPEPFRGMYLEKGEEITARLDSACRYADLLDKGAVKLTDAEKMSLAAVYDGCLNYLDSRVGELMQALRDDDLYDSTLIIITSDHGECFGEYGKYGHGDLLSRPLIHIPLLVRYPALFPAPEVRGELVSITDIFHSLAGLLDLSGAAKTGLRARDIFAGKIKAEPCYSSFFLGRTPKEDMRQHFDTQSVWTPANRHYILRGTEAEECFDLAADFNEENNLCPEKIPQREVETVIAAERNKLAVFVEDDLDLKITGEQKFDPQVVKAMRALGYVGGGNNSDPAAQEQLKEHPHFLEHFKTGNFFFSLDSLPAAETELRKALDMSPQNERLRIKLSFILYRNGKYEETLNTLHPIINRTAFEKETLLILGLTFKAQGKAERAIEYFVKASELQPARLDVAMNAAELLIGLRRFGEAKLYVERVMAHNYGNLPVLLNVLALYLKNDNPSGARDVILDLQKRARSGTLYGLLAHVYEAMRLEREAEDCRMQAAALGMSGARLSRLIQSLKDTEIQQDKEP